MFNYTASIQSQEVHSVEPASWNKCGRPKNAYIVLRDKRVVCARYRDSDVRFILGKSVSIQQIKGKAVFLLGWVCVCVCVSVCVCLNLEVGKKGHWPIGQVYTQKGFSVTIYYILGCFIALQKSLCHICALNYNLKQKGKFLNYTLEINCPLYWLKI